MLRFLTPQPRPAPSSPAEPVASGTGPHSGDEATLLRQVLTGDPAALERVYRRESARVYRYALALCGNPAWAADAMQDAFVALAGAATGFDPARGSLGAWLAGVARHALLARWRLERREQRVDPLAEDPAGEGDGAQAQGACAAVPEPPPGPEALLSRAQEVERLWQALRRLPLAQCEAVVLVDLQERSYAEAARIAGVDANTLRTRLHRGRSRLALGLQGDPR